MDLKRARPKIKKSRLENEVILAVVLLYALISGAMLLIHHVQSPLVKTQSSSTSPAHNPSAGEVIPAPTSADLPAAKPVR